jgi:hypothetical protein
MSKSGARVRERRAVALDMSDSAPKRETDSHSQTRAVKEPALACGVSNGACRSSSSGPQSSSSPASIDSSASAWHSLHLLLRRKCSQMPGPPAFLAPAHLPLVLADARSPAFRACDSLPLLLADARPPAVLAPAPLPLVLADGRSAAFLACAPLPLVLADARPPLTNEPSFGCCSGVFAGLQLKAPALAGAWPSALPPPSIAAPRGDPSVVKNNKRLALTASCLARPPDGLYSAARACSSGQD